MEEEETQSLTIITTMSAMPDISKRRREREAAQPITLQGPASSDHKF
jgi:hypothetical protein